MDATKSPDRMPVAFALVAGALAGLVLGLAVVVGAPMLETGWEWIRGVVVVFLVVAGGDLAHAAITRSWSGVVYVVLWFGW